MSAIISSILDLSLNIFEILFLIILPIAWVIEGGFAIIILFSGLLQLAFGKNFWKKPFGGK